MRMFFYYNLIFGGFVMERFSDLMLRSPLGAIIIIALLTVYTVEFTTTEGDNLNGIPRTREGACIYLLDSNWNGSKKITKGYHSLEVRDIDYIYGTIGSITEKVINIKTGKPVRLGDGKMFGFLEKFSNGFLRRQSGNDILIHQKSIL